MTGRASRTPHRYGLFLPTFYNDRIMILCRDVLSPLSRLLQRFGLQLVQVAAEESIPGSFWGEPEAGLIGDRLYVRADTPLHSALHEACHYICMDPRRRQALDTDAGGDYAEENGVCYLQVVLTEYLPGLTRQQAFADMDAWGYSFRLGSAAAWFQHDAEDALAWLIQHGILNDQQQPRWQVRRR